MTADQNAAVGTGQQVGVFLPAMPRNAYRTVALFAIAGRMVCEDPERLTEITQELEAAIAPLVLPERAAAADCQRLWSVFARVVPLGKKPLIREAAMAMYGDLDRVAQRLDLPPLPDWEELPLQVEESHAVAVTPTQDPHPAAGGGESLAVIQQRARQLAVPKPGGGKNRAPLAAGHVLTLMIALAPAERHQLFEAMLRKGSIGRTEINLLQQRLRKQGDGIGEGDAALLEVLERIGTWLLASPQ